MAVAVVVGVGAALTLVPAILAIAGRVLLWPNAPSDESPPPDPGAQGRVVTFASRHPYVTALVGIVLLAAPASGLRLLELGDPVMKDLPKSASARQGYDAVSRAFSPGLTGPTMVLVEGEGVGGRTLALNRFESKLRTVAGVSLVLGPADRPFSDNGGIAVSQNGNAARYLLVLGADPESHAAIETLDRVKRLAPGFAQQAGLGGAQVSFAGDTAITSELVDQTKTSLIRVAPAAFAVVYLLLALLLRSWLAPIYLLVVGAAVPAAALGLTVYVFQGLLGYGELAFFVPIAVGVLLLALGSDYNVFLVGRIWSVSRRMPMREAVRTAGSRAAGAITTAGIILALSFAAVALIPIASFREIAFAMAAGLLLDTFVARTLLIPALISIFQRSERDRTDAEPSVPAPV
jgi:RND superfamily putative drug exporter